MSDHFAFLGVLPFRPSPRPPPFAHVALVTPLVRVWELVLHGRGTEGLLFTPSSMRHHYFSRFFSPDPAFLSLLSLTFSPPFGPLFVRWEPPSLITHAPFFSFFFIFFPSCPAFFTVARRGFPEGSFSFRALPEPSFATSFFSCGFCFCGCGRPFFFVLVRPEVGQVCAFCLEGILFFRLTLPSEYRTLDGVFLSPCLLFLLSPFLIFVGGSAPSF